MKRELKAKRITKPEIPGFIACYKGKEIAFARSFDVLVTNPEVRSLLGKNELVIGHTVPEGMLAVY